MIKYKYQENEWLMVHANDTNLQGLQQELNQVEVAMDSVGNIIDEKITTQIESDFIESREGVEPNEFVDVIYTQYFDTEKEAIEFYNKNLNQ